MVCITIATGPLSPPSAPVEAPVPTRSSGLFSWDPFSLASTSDLGVLVEPAHSNFRVRTA